MRRITTFIFNYRPIGGYSHINLSFNPLNTGSIDFLIAQEITPLARRPIQGVFRQLEDRRSMTFGRNEDMHRKEERQQVGLLPSFDRALLTFHEQAVPQEGPVVKQETSDD